MVSAAGWKGASHPSHLVRWYGTLSYGRSTRAPSVQGQGDRVRKADATALEGSKIPSAAELKKGWFISFEDSFRSLIWSVQFPSSTSMGFQNLRLSRTSQSWTELLRHLNMLAVCNQISDYSDICQFQIRLMPFQIHLNLYAPSSFNLHSFFLALYVSLLVIRGLPSIFSFFFTLVTLRPTRTFQDFC